jgi:hypoxanthine phosphoribosyltransferase
MIDAHLFGEWDEAPEAMDIDAPYVRAIERCVDLVRDVRSGGDGAASEATELFVLAPAIVNVALNYKICLEFGLPLHPTFYFEFPAGGRGGMVYEPWRVDFARALFRDSIALARSAYRLDPDFEGAATRFLSSTPDFLRGFIYASRRDRYTWRAAEPEKVKALANAALAGGRPSLALGAAHGSIMAGLLLAEYLGCDLHFLRFSMFKRKDEEPIASEYDESLIAASASREGGLFVFDEDSASGTTLSRLAERVRRVAPSFRTGAVIRHMTSSFKPDCVGKTWWD